MHSLLAGSRFLLLVLMLGLCSCSAGRSAVLEGQDYSLYGHLTLVLDERVGRTGFAVRLTDVELGTSPLVFGRRPDVELGPTNYMPAGKLASAARKFGQERRVNVVGRGGPDNVLLVLRIVEAASVPRPSASPAAAAPRSGRAVVKSASLERGTVLVLECHGSACTKTADLLVKTRPAPAGGAPTVWVDRTDDDAGCLLALGALTPPSHTVKIDIAPLLSGSPTSRASLVVESGDGKSHVVVVHR